MLLLTGGFGKRVGDRSGEFGSAAAGSLSFRTDKLTLLLLGLGGSFARLGVDDLLCLRLGLRGPSAGLGVLAFLGEVCPRLNFDGEGV